MNLQPDRIDGLLIIDGRQALQQLIRDVETRMADFQVILVYDVSRWGRFQGADESATSTSAGAQASRSPIAPNSSRTTARQSRRSSKV